MFGVFICFVPFHIWHSNAGIGGPWKSAADGGNALMDAHCHKSAEELRGRPERSSLIPEYVQFPAIL